MMSMSQSRMPSFEYRIVISRVNTKGPALLIVPGSGLVEGIALGTRSFSRVKTYDL